jgi:AraC-like DNA-binding protein
MEAAFGRAGFSRRTFAQPELVVPLVRIGRAFKSAAAAAAQAEFGLLVGLRAGSRLPVRGQGQAPGDGYVSGELMRIISRPATFPNAFLTLGVSGTTCTIGCVGLPRNAIARNQLADCAMGFAAGALRLLCGPRWRPWSFRFDSRPISDLARHMALLQAPVTYNAKVTAMDFDSAWLDRETGASPGHSNDASARPLDRDFVGEVRSVLASWTRIERPSAPAVALELGLQPRTLNKYLAKTGTGFNKMLEDARYERAQIMLRDPALPVVSVAWSLGYADASAFSRAFRRWSGVTPSEWREAANSGAL